MITNIDEIKSSIDIVDVIGGYLDLKKSGGNYKANCPFHSEKSASFVISPSKQIFKCFGCGAGGDLFKFIQDYEKIEFYDAVEKIANEHNIAVQRSNEDRKDYRRVLDLIQSWFVDNLRDSDIEYLKSRGLKRATIKEWGLGYAPRSAKSLEYIRDMQLPMGELRELGIIRENESRVYSHFSERIMIPIYSDNNRLLGWSGRSLKSEIKAKYVNSVDSAVFRKGSIFFGLNRAKKSIYDKKFMIIFEGQLDVILAHQAGIKTAVATQGTALTDSNIKVIKKIGCKVLLSFDGDRAGVDASIKSARALAINGVRGRVVLFDSGDDAADMVASGRASELKQLLMGGVEFIEFVLKNIINSKNSDAFGKDEALKECMAFLEELNSAVLLAEYRNRVYSWLGIDIKVQRVEIKRVAASSVDFKLNIYDSVIYSAMCQSGYIDTILNIVDDEAWGGYLPIWQSLLSGVVDIEFKEKVEVLGAEVLSEERVVSFCKAIERAYLKRVKSECRDVAKLIEINKKIALWR